MSVYHDFFGKGFDRQYVVVYESDDFDPIACLICDSYVHAVGYIMLALWEFAESYKKDGDFFEIGELKNGENGDYIKFRFRSHFWSTEDTQEECYRILYYDIPKPEWDRPKEKEKK